MRVLLATTNPGKRREILSALLPLKGIEVLSLDDVNPPISCGVEETGQSYGENALIKARHYFQKTGFPVIAEDSGIEVAALAGELGVNTRRWGAGPQASDDVWLAHFMDRLAGVSDRSARFVSHVVFIDPSGHQAFEGDCWGVITHKIEGPIPIGIPISAVFKPQGQELVYSALDELRKNSLSHRGNAIKHLKQWLQKHKL